MANANSTRELVRRRGKAIHTEGLRRTLEGLARNVPDSDQARSSYPAGEYPQRYPKLRTSQQVVSHDSATRYATTVRYTAPQADFTEKGTPPHRIKAKNGPFLRFYWPKAPAALGGPGRYAFAFVNHPGSHKHDGWFRRQTKRWGDHLRAAAR